MSHVPDDSWTNHLQRFWHVIRNLTRHPDGSDNCMTVRQQSPRACKQANKETVLQWHGQSDRAKGKELGAGLEWHWPKFVSCGGVHVISFVMSVRPSACIISLWTGFREISYWRLIWNMSVKAKPLFDVRSLSCDKIWIRFFCAVFCVLTRSQFRW